MKLKRKREREKYCTHVKYSYRGVHVDDTVARTLVTHSRIYCIYTHARTLAYDTRILERSKRERARVWKGRERER